VTTRQMGELVVSELMSGDALEVPRGE
jgi:hypothetical protein